MNFYISNHHLSKSNVSFVNQLSIVYISKSIREVLANSRWKTTMNKEIKSLQKKIMEYENSLILHKETNSLDVDEFIW
jgi:hypothetical protein